MADTDFKEREPVAWERLTQFEKRIAELEGQVRGARRREQNLVLQACLHCRNHSEALVDCTVPQCAEARAVLAPEGTQNSKEGR